jgi:ABC-type branched-subunit amino acid transport system substrate-binding protein
MKCTCIYKGIEFETNNANNGLFIWTSQGAGYDWNRKTKQYVPSKRLKQISGTCDFSASSDKNLYQKVAKKYKNIDKNMID